VAEIDIRWLGRVEFAAALAVQEEIVRSHAGTGDVVLLLEHEPVYTTGRGGREEHLPGANGRARAPDVPLFRIGRGGDATYHGPGQLVGYALVDLRARGGDVHRFLRRLEDGVIGILAAYGIAGQRLAGRTGVWVSARTTHPTEVRSGSRKIASIGIGVRRGVSMHGFALNVSVDLGAFASIVPCGIADAEMTSMEAEGLAPVPAIAEVASVAARILPRAIDGDESERAVSGALR